MPTLSIIVPVYKVEKYLENCVNSILEQTYDDWELILVDDGSPDRCGAMCDNFAKIDEKIKVIHRKNGGLSAARNSGIYIAQGKYITFVDADDDVMPDTYRLNVQFLEEHTEVDVLQYPILWDFSSEKEHIDKTEPRFYTSEKEIFLAWYNNRPIYNSACNKIYRRDLFDNLRYDEGRIYEDKFMMLKMIPRMHCLYDTDQGCYRYYAHEGSILHTFNMKRALDWVDAEVLTLEQMYRFADTKAEWIPRWMKTLRYLMNAKKNSPDSDILIQLKSLKKCRPAFSAPAIKKDRFWMAFIAVFGINAFQHIYLKLLR